jgi:hypothetical protein
MNKNQQLLLNLEKEIQYIANSNNTEYQKKSCIKDWFQLARCTMSSKPHCEVCVRVASCGRLTMWNDITDKELLRKS